MELNLKRPICFFDLETTGIQVAKDRIVEISVLKIHPKGLQEKKTWLVNPEVPIPSEATAVHGITDEKVQHAPKFKEIAKDIYLMIKDADLAGFNSDRFRYEKQGVCRCADYIPQNGEKNLGGSLSLLLRQVLGGRPLR